MSEKASQLVGGENSKWRCDCVYIPIGEVLNVQCPVCENVNLVMADRAGIEIDYYPKCRGVWLDRGELDKIIERSLPTAPAQSANDGRQPAHDQGYHPAQQPSYGHGPSQHDSGYYKKKKREGFLSDLFDFD